MKIRKLRNKKEKELNTINLEDCITKLSYRPFDKRFLFYSDSMVDWTRSSVMNHIKSQDNLCLLIPRQLAENTFHHVWFSWLLKRLGDGEQVYNEDVGGKWNVDWIYDLFGVMNLSYRIVSIDG